MSDVVVDTDVASAILKGQLPDSLRRRLAGRRLTVTFVTVGELTQWTYLHRWGPQRRAGLQVFFASVVVLPGSFRAATTWGEIQAHARLRGRPRPVNDSWIAACCIARDLPLATLNIKDDADFALQDVAGQTSPGLVSNSGLRPAVRGTQRCRQTSRQRGQPARQTSARLRRSPSSSSPGPALRRTRSAPYRTPVRGVRSIAITIDAPLPRSPARLSDLARSSIDVPGGRIDLVHPRGAMEVLYEQNFDAHEEYPPYWAALWPSSVALARAVAAAKPAGARVLELGCGLGLPSIAAALGGAHVLATDRSSDALGFATYNAGLNGVSIEVGVCSWAQPESVLSRAPWDLVLAADVLYLHNDLRDLDDLLPRVVAGTGQVWMADPGRPPAAAFVESCTRWAEVSQYPSDDPGVTVHRFRPRNPPRGSGTALHVVD